MSFTFNNIESGSSFAYKVTNNLFDISIYNLFLICLIGMVSHRLGFMLYSIPVARGPDHKPSRSWPMEKPRILPAAIERGVLETQFQNSFCPIQLIQYDSFNTVSDPY